MAETTERTVGTLASEAYNCFESAERPSLEHGSDGHARVRGERFWRIREGSPDWVQDLVREVFHDNANVLPDDSRYELAMDMLSELALGQEPDEWDSIEPDVYTSDLLRWLSNDPDAVGLCDEVLRELGPSDLLGLIGAAQSQQRENYRQQAYDWLSERLEAEQDEEE